MNKDNIFRTKMVEFITWRWFDNFILAVILVNSLFLGMQNQINDDPNIIGNFLVNSSEIPFTIIFTLESVCKIIAMSFIIDDGSYLRDTWNWLDFTVVITSLLSLSGSFNGVSSLRTFRLFRPLRSLNAIPSMKKLINTMLSAVPALLNVFSLLLFMFIILAILALNLWSGLQHNFCRLTPVPFDGQWPIDPTQGWNCGGDAVCNPNT